MWRTTITRLRAAAVLGCVILAGCTTGAAEMLSLSPEINPDLATTERLRELPPAAQKLVVAVYGFGDRTGQRKPNSNVAELSTAVTQGADAILLDAAFLAGNGTWFDVIERTNLDGLLQERQIIRAQRDEYLGPGEQPLPALLFAGMLLEGGIISFDTNMVTGGFGARLLGIGGSTEYRADVVSVYLRAVSTQTGRVVGSVKTTKTLYSASLEGNVFRFVAADEILELDAGITANEPTQIAVRQAIESALYALIMEGALADQWEFADAEAGERALEEYRNTRSGIVRRLDASDDQPT